MTLSLNAAVVVQVLRGAEPHYRRFLEEAVAAGREVRICSLVLEQLAHAALKTDRRQAHLDQLDALMAHVDVEPFTGEDALSAARLQAERETGVSARLSGSTSTLDVLAAGQAVNRGWLMVADRLGEVVAGAPTMLWCDPSGPIDLTRPGMAALARARR